MTRDRDDIFSDIFADFLHDEACYRINGMSKEEYTVFVALNGVSDLLDVGLPIDNIWDVLAHLPGEVCQPAYSQILDIIEEANRRYEKEKNIS